MLARPVPIGVPCCTRQVWQNHVGLPHDPHFKSINLVLKVLQKVFMGTVSGWHLESTWTSELSRRLESVEEAGSVTETKHNLHQVMLEYVTYCTRVETTSTLELALWKAKMNGLAKENLNNDIDRATCRLKCGANVVLANVTRFAWDGIGEKSLCFPLSPVGF